MHTQTHRAPGHHLLGSTAPRRPDCVLPLPPSKQQTLCDCAPSLTLATFGGRMEGFRAGEDEMERVNMADVLQLLIPRPGINGAHRTGRARGFRCKTCNRRFPTFQALGGHSTSHRKLKPAGGGVSDSPKVHGCSICGLEFAMGQALGGHMRRHRGDVEASSSQRRCAEKPSPISEGLVRLDLNLPPSEEEEEEDMELLTLGLGGHDKLSEKVPVVGCMGCSAITY